jgi:hypothetical protein
MTYYKSSCQKDNENYPKRNNTREHNAGQEKEKIKGDMGGNDPPDPLPIGDFTNSSLYTDTILGPEENVLILDSGVDISYVGRGFQILFYTGAVLCGCSHGATLK